MQGTCTGNSLGNEYRPDWAQLSVVEKCLSDRTSSDSKITQKRVHNGKKLAGKGTNIWCSLRDRWPVADPREGPGGPGPPPLCLDQIEARRAEKNCFWDRPPYLRVWMTAPPIWRSGSATVDCTWKRVPKDVNNPAGGSLSNHGDSGENITKKIIIIRDLSNNRVFLIL